jgi:polysaccharide export outer membrane protein
MWMVAACSSQAPAISRGPAALPTAPESYVLGPGDQLRIQVYGQSDLSGNFVVSQKGTVALPLIGDITATGTTTQQLTLAMEDALSPDYIREPKVSVEVINFRPFYILGEVNRPGTYPFTSELTVMNAVATAGGFTYRANSKEVHIKHADETEERVYQLTSGTPVRPGDTVRIAERLF